MADAETVECIRGMLGALAVPMDNIPFPKAAYNRLFPEGKVATPLGEVKLGEHQFEKLKEKGRGHLLGAMAQTLKEPIVILAEKDEKGRDATLYVKSFNDENSSKTKNVVSVVVDIDGKPVSISTGERRAKQIVEKIKMAGRILFIKNASSPTIGTADKSDVAQQK